MSRFIKSRKVKTLENSFTLSFLYFLSKLNLNKKEFSDNVEIINITEIKANPRLKIPNSSILKKRR